MSFSWKLGRIAGIDVYLHATFLLMLALIGLARGGLSLVGASAFFGCVLLHELGHAMAARRYRIGTQDITLYPIGGIARLRRLPRAAGPELVIALAGPAVNLAIAVALAAILGLRQRLGFHFGTGLADGARELMRLNVLLAVFNMAPAFPMDGGRVLRAVLSGRLGRIRATEIAARLGQVLAVAFALACLPHLFLTVPQLLVAAFVFFAASAELAHVRAEGSRGDDDNPSHAPPGSSWIYRGNGVWQLAPAVAVADDGLGLRSRGPWL